MQRRNTLKPNILSLVSDNCFFEQLFLVCYFNLHPIDKVKSEKYLDNRMSQSAYLFH